MKSVPAILGKESQRRPGTVWEKWGGAQAWVIWWFFDSPYPSSELQVAHCYVSFIFLSVFLNTFYLSDWFTYLVNGLKIK